MTVHEMVRDLLDKMTRKERQNTMTRAFKKALDDPRGSA